MSAILATPDAQMAQSISTRVEEVAINVEAKSRLKIRPHVQDIAALAEEWQTTIEFFENSIFREDQYFDFRNLRDVLLPAAEKTKLIYAEIESTALNSSDELEGLCELPEAKVQIERILRKLESWPSNDPTRRNAARESISRDEIVSDAELAAM